MPKHRKSTNKMTAAKKEVGKPATPTKQSVDTSENIVPNKTEVKEVTPSKQSVTSDIVPMKTSVKDGTSPKSPASKADEKHPTPTKQSVTTTNGTVTKPCDKEVTSSKQSKSDPEKIIVRKSVSKDDTPLKEPESNIETTVEKTEGAEVSVETKPNISELKKKFETPPSPVAVEPTEVKMATNEIMSDKDVEMAQGLTFTSDGEVSFSVWAPHAVAAFLRLEDPALLVPLERKTDHFSVRLLKGHVKHGDRYRVEMDAFDKRIIRRDPFARATDYESEWCVAQDDTTYEWKMTEWKRPEFASYIIYELHVGSFTNEGTFKSAMKKLEHIASLGFTCVQLMPILEHSDAWGYNPRQFFSLHGKYGKPDELKGFVDEAHKLGLAVIIDVVMHHASVKKNALWEYDGWSEHGNGGIYHEGAQDTEWGRSLAYWKREVMHMLEESCIQWLTTYRCDGLRFDSANDLPHDICRTLTSYAHKVAPGAYLTAEVTPENPKAVHELGFDALWVHSGYFDIIHQHRALGRGHHGGGEYTDGWDFPRLRTVMGLHYGFSSPVQCIKYILGSHDQVGCKNGGAIYEDYKMIGGQHRYATDQFGAGRTDPWACSATRAWLVANATAAGMPMLFMGTEWAAAGWWDTKDRKMDWSLCKDDIGIGMMKCVKDVFEVRKKFICLQIGGTNTLHEDRNNGVLAVDRIWEDQRMVIVINAGRGCWQSSEYKVWVGGEGYALKEVLCSADKKYGGWDEQHGNGDTVIGVYDGFASINVPSQSSMIFEIIPC